MSRSFISGPPREGASLRELISYLKPKSRGELSFELRKVLTSQTEPQSEAEESWGIISDLGLSPVEFAQLALSRPELWDSGDTEYLETVAGGYPPNDHLIELAEDFFTEAAAPPPRDLEELKSIDLEALEDEENEEDLDPTQRHERALTALYAPGPALTPLRSEESLPVVGDTSDDWWKKK